MARSTGRCAVVARDRFLGFYEDVRSRVGRSYRAYKLLEVDRLDRAFESILRSRRRGADYVAYMVHRLSWDQPLPNLNHRTTLAFTHAVLRHHGLAAPWARITTGLRHRPATEEWMRRSKGLLGERDQWFQGTSAWRELARRQEQVTKEWILQEDQSGKLAYVGPHFLRNFLSCSVRKGRGGGA